MLSSLIYWPSQVNEMLYHLLIRLLELMLAHINIMLDSLAYLFMNLSLKHFSKLKEPSCSLKE